jgi:hypothetical protein
MIAQKEPMGKEKSKYGISTQETRDGSILKVTKVA